MKKTILFSLLTLCLFAISACQQESPKNQSKVTLSPSLKDFNAPYRLVLLLPSKKSIPEKATKLNNKMEK